MARDRTKERGRDVPVTRGSHDTARLPTGTHAREPTAARLPLPALPHGSRSIVRGSQADELPRLPSCPQSPPFCCWGRGAHCSHRHPGGRTAHKGDPLPAAHPPGPRRPSSPLRPWGGCLRLFVSYKNTLQDGRQESPPPHARGRPRRLYLQPSQSGGARPAATLIADSRSRRGRSVHTGGRCQRQPEPGPAGRRGREPEAQPQTQVPPTPASPQLPDARRSRRAPTQQRRASGQPRTHPSPAGHGGRRAMSPARRPLLTGPGRPARRRAPRQPVPPTPVALGHKGRPALPPQEPRPRLRWGRPRGDRTHGPPPPQPAPLCSAGRRA